MNKLLVSICLALCGISVVAQDFPAPPSQHTSSIPGARFEVMQSPLAAKWTFRLDKFSGRVWQLVRTEDEDTSWEEMPVYESAKLPTPSRARFQLFTSGLAARHTFLLDTDSGKTWILVTSKRKNKDGAETEIVGWQPFAE
jgi:hypothetical protein